MVLLSSIKESKLYIIITYSYVNIRNIKKFIISISAGPRLGSPSNSGHLGQSVFDYIEKLAARSSVFHNFLYNCDRTNDSQVCLGQSSILIRFIN